MSDKSGIEWTDATWNPVTGCIKVSPGCTHCYAETFAERFRGVPGHPYEQGFDLRLWPERLDQPLRWQKPRRVFVNSMSDLFHEGVPDGFIARVWSVMGQTLHQFQILTKRPARMFAFVQRWEDTTGDNARDRENGMPPMPRGPEAVRATYTSGRAHLFADMLDSMGEPPPDAAYPLYDWMSGPRWWPAVLPNVALGVSVESQYWADRRIPLLLQTPAAVRFLSCEPLLKPVDLRPTLRRGLHWVIAGGESGPGARPCEVTWLRYLRNQCQEAGIPFFLKQLGGFPDKRGHEKALLDGRLWHELPNR